MTNLHNASAERLCDALLALQSKEECCEYGEGGCKSVIGKLKKG